MSFRLSFHQALLGPTGGHWLDDPPDVSCQDSTQHYPVDGPLLSCKQQVGGSSPPPAQRHDPPGRSLAVGGPAAGRDRGRGPGVGQPAAGRPGRGAAQDRGLYHPQRRCPLRAHPTTPTPTASRWRQASTGAVQTGIDRELTSGHGPARGRQGPRNAGVDHRLGVMLVLMLELLHLAQLDSGGLAGQAGVVVLAVLGFGLLAWCSPRYLLRLLVPDAAAAATTAAPAGPLLGCRQAPSRRADHRVQARRRHQARAPTVSSS